MRRRPWKALAEPVYVALEAAASDRRLQRIERLMESDPEKDSPEGIELSRLVDEQMEYERSAFPMGAQNGED